MAPTFPGGNVMKLSLALAAGLLAASASLHAQAPSDAKPPERKGFDCAQAKDPKACEERREKMKARHEKMKEWHEKKAAAFDKAYEGCKGKATGAEFRACMREQHKQDRKK